MGSRSVREGPLLSGRRFADGKRPDALAGGKQLRARGCMQAESTPRPTTGSGFAEFTMASAQTVTMSALMISSGIDGPYACNGRW